MQVDVIYAQEKINYADYIGKPVFMIQNIAVSEIRNPNVTPVKVLQLRQHIIETEDAYMQLG